MGRFWGREGGRENCALLNVFITLEIEIPGERKRKEIVKTIDNASKECVFIPFSFVFVLENGHTHTSTNDEHLAD